MLRATVFFKDKSRGYATMVTDQVFHDDIGDGQMLFVYYDGQLRGAFRIDIIDSVHVTETKE